MKEEYKTITSYRIPLNISEYDYLEVDVESETRIRINFLVTRWRDKQETIAMLKEIIKHLS